MQAMYIASLIGPTPQDSMRLMLLNEDRKLKTRKIVKQLADFGYDFGGLEEAIINGQGQLDFRDGDLYCRKGDWESRIQLSEDGDVININAHIAREA